MKKTELLDRRFGIIAIKKGLATRREIDRILWEQKRLSSESGSHLLIGDILVKEGIMTAEQRDSVFSIQNRLNHQPPHNKEIIEEAQDFQESQRNDSGVAPTLSEEKKTEILDRRFGMIAIKRGFATRKEVDSALYLQKREFAEKKSSARIGNILVKTGVLTKEQKDTVLSIQNRLNNQPIHKEEKPHNTGS